MYVWLVVFDRGWWWCLRGRVELGLLILIVIWDYVCCIVVLWLILVGLLLWIYLLSDYHAWQTIKTAFNLDPILLHLILILILPNFLQHIHSLNLKKVPRPHPNTSNQTQPQPPTKYHRNDPKHNILWRMYIYKLLYFGCDETQCIGNCGK